MTATETETETAVKSRPILFSGEMVRAILDGRKSMTRRVVKPQPEQLNDRWFKWIRPRDIPHEFAFIPGLQDKALINYCPYGKPGDRLWVKETHAFDRVIESGEDFYNSYSKVIYRATEPELHGFSSGWKSSIFMPRWASRITLEVTGVRVERVQDISEADCIAEGIVLKPGPDGLTNQWTKEHPDWAYKNLFNQLWQDINRTRPGCDWDSNPWVWVIEFKVVQP